MVVKSAFKPSVKSVKDAKRVGDMLKTLEAAKSIMFYALRNQGWGKKRLMELNNKFDEYIDDIDTGRFSTNDILGVLEDEVGMTIMDIAIRKDGKIR